MCVQKMLKTELEMLNNWQLRKKYEIERTFYNWNMVKNGRMYI